MSKLKLRKDESGLTEKERKTILATISTMTPEQIDGIRQTIGEYLNDIQLPEQVHHKVKKKRSDKGKPHHWKNPPKSKKEPQPVDDPEEVSE